MRKLIAATIFAAALAAPLAGSAHDYVSQTVCLSAAGGPNDCVRVDTDTEFEDGLIVTLDGDDTDPRGDDISDGYVSVTVNRDGAVVNCEDSGGFNHADYRDGGDEDDANGTNDDCGA
jgi:hypothetical protein